MISGISDITPQVGTTEIYGDDSRSSLSTPVFSGLYGAMCKATKIMFCDEEIDKIQNALTGPHWLPF